MWMQKRDELDPDSLWEFPGGKIRPGEEPDTAACREIREETGLVLNKNRLQLFTIHSLTCDSSCLCLYIHLYHPDFPLKTGRWFFIKENMNTFPGNRHFINLIANHLYD